MIIYLPVKKNENTLSQPKIETYVTTVEYDSKSTKAVLDAFTLFCINDLRPFATCSGQAILDYTKTILKIGRQNRNINASQLLPHPFTVSRNVDKIYENIFSDLQNAE